LLIDEPAPGTAALCSDLGCTTGNAIQGEIPQGTNSILFRGVPLIAPGTNRVIRITNIRVNAATTAVASVPIPVNAVVTISPPGSVALTNPNQIVGYVQSSLKFTAGSVSAVQCFDLPNPPANDGTAVVTFSELFPTAFKVQEQNSADQNQPGFTYYSESGFVDTALNGGIGDAGLADSATKFRLWFRNVQTGVTITVPTELLDEASNVRAVLTSPSSPELSVVGGNAVAIYDYVADTTGGTADPDAARIAALTLENLTGTVKFSFTANPGSNSPSLSPPDATLAGSYYPIYTTATGGLASLTQPIPRFVDNSVAAAVLKINPCVTNLLFPFVTNHSGFDTGLAISNTSEDPFGTSTQAGTCTLNAYGANAPSAITTPSVAAGTTYTTLASSAAPNFQGYVIAVCRFQYAHGYAFISDLGAQKFAEGYMALIIPDQGGIRTPNPFPCAGQAIPTGGVGVIPACPTTGEQLGQ